MKRIGLNVMLAALLGLPAAGCDSTTIDNVTFMYYEAGVPLDAGTVTIPGKPLLGQQIDRAGRPAINNALTDPFGTNPPALTTDQVKNQYNAAVFSNWNAYTMAQYLPTNLAIFDGLDGTCGNQFKAAAAVSAQRYSALAMILADDRLYVNANVNACNTYLGVEQGTANDCGGRTPVMKVMDAIYNLLITGNAAGTYTNGVSGTLSNNGGPTTTFPFLQPPV